MHTAGHGTALVLLGNSPQDDTILGAPDRDENQRGLAKYLNTRYFDFQKVDVSVAEFPSDKKDLWPSDPVETRSNEDRRKLWQYRSVKGAIHYIKRDLKQSSLAASDLVALTSTEQATLHWYLRNGEPLSTNVSEQNTGFVALLYRNELWNFSPHPSTMRRFGISAAISKNLFLIIEPREYDSTEPQCGGFYPNNSRTQLLRGGSASGKEAPFDEWSDEFRANMPAIIVDAIHASRPADEKLDDEDLKRLKDRFGSRWRIPTFLVTSDGTKRTRVIDDLVEGLGKGNGGEGTRIKVSSENDAVAYGLEHEGSLPAKQRLLGAGLPDCKFFPESTFEEQWMLANYLDRSTANPTGLIELNQGHPVLRKHIEELSAQYAETEAETVARVVRETYRKLAIAHVAHSEQFKVFPELTRSEINRKFRSPEALTMGHCSDWSEQKRSRARSLADDSEENSAWIERAQLLRSDIAMEGLERPRRWKAMKSPQTVARKRSASLLLLASLAICCFEPALADTTLSSAISPVVLQFCAPTAVVRPSGVNSMDISYVNTTPRDIKVVLLRIGDTAIANLGASPANAAVKWRVPAVAGSCSLNAVRFADGTDWISPGTSRIPPIVLQYCAPTAVVNPSPNLNSMDLSFVNLTAKSAKIVIVNIGGTDVANVGTFSPNAPIKWRIPAAPGPCFVHGVRFDDGTEWSAP